MEYYIRKQKILNNMRKKYKNAFEFDKKKLAAIKIVRFVRKKILFRVINYTDKELKQIPGRFIMRVKLTCDNLIPPDDKYSSDPEMELALRRSMNFQNVPPIPIALDMRYYGLKPHFPIFLHKTPYYLNNYQIAKIKKSWRKVDPETPTGIHFKQDMEYYKALCQDLL